MSDLFLTEMHPNDPSCLAIRPYLPIKITIDYTSLVSSVLDSGYYKGTVTFIEGIPQLNVPSGFNIGLMGFKYSSNDTSSAGSSNPQTVGATPQRHPGGPAIPVDEAAIFPDNIDFMGITRGMF